MGKTKLLLGILVILLAGCLDLENIQTDSTATMIDTATVSTPTVRKPTSTPIPTITQTKQPSTLTPSFTPTAEVLPPRTECLEIVSGLPETASRTGSILFETYPLTILNMETKEQMLIPNEEYIIYTFSASPDLQWIAFDDGHKLMLMDANGETYEVIDWDEKWWRVEGWLNENQVLVRMDNPDYGPVLPPLGVVDIHTKEYWEIERDYPQINYVDEYDAWFFWRAITFYNPTSSVVAYPGRSSGEGYTFILFDLSTNEILTEVMDYRLRTISPPQWTPEGTHLLLAKEAYVGNILPSSEFHQEFFLVNVDGEVSQLTHFNDFYEFSEIMGFSISNDGRKVAFWFRDKSLSREEHLYILDLQTLDVFDTCITSVGMVRGSGPATPPIWSPDSSALIVRRDRFIDDSDENEVYEVILIDILNGYATRIVDDMRPLGWLIAP